MRSTRASIAVLALALVACQHEPRLALKYQLLTGLMASDVIRVETRVAVAAGDPRAFTADQPYRTVDTGIGYEVRDFEGGGVRTLLITHDATLGFPFEEEFKFTLLPPVGNAPPLEIRARALGAGVGQILADTGPVAAEFGKDTEAKLPLGDLRCGGITTCTGNDSCCNATCLDVSSAVSSCGACGNACGDSGDECSGGNCRCNGGSGCASGTSCCAGTGCIDTTADPFNCGSCGKTCALGESCAGGKCSCGSTTCTTGQACCAGTCTDGGCVCGSTTCAADKPLCCGGTVCSDTGKDDANCGTCGHACSAPFACSGGACKCNGTAVCTGSDTCCDSGCANLANDPRNCGGCGQACGEGEACVDSKCVCGTSGAACDAGELCCMSVLDNARHCVDGTSDKNNCGACGRVCAATEQCANGACTCPGVGASCTAGKTCCAANGGCVDLASSHDHCGGCDTKCGQFEECFMGMCRASTQMCSPQCENQTKCQAGECYCGTVQTRCDDMATGELCCPGVDGCVKTRTDANNCGGCGRSCAAQGKNACCNSTCVAFDNNNCGGCGVICPTLTSCSACNGVYDCHGVLFICSPGT
jgi:hypothetical protein